ncbi:MAG: HNH endonuclease [Acetatifactor sp.]|nr:HNH endonuclease [Acetatifactor sp.]
MRKMNIKINRILSLVVSFALLITSFSGCADNHAAISNPSKNDITTEEIVSHVIETLTEGQTESEKPGIEEVEKAGISVIMSDNWEDYIGDVETFVYGLISNELGLGFDVFPAYVDLSDGTVISGIAYSDYEDCYVNDDESQCIFMAGFMPYCGELDIPSDEFDDGLFIQDAEYDNEKFSFIMGYESDEYRDHCVVYGQYLQYGIDDSGKIFYETSPYEQGKCNETLGSLYSFDEAKYVYDDNVGGNLLLSGISLYSQIDYAELENAINEMLRTQDRNSYTMEIETSAYFAQEAVEAYFMTLQEESFLGYSTADLIEETRKLDPKECYRITNEGLIKLSFEDEGGEASLVKWIVGSTCAIVAIIGFVGASVSKTYPPLSAAAGAISGLAIDVFMQVVIEDVRLVELDWRKSIVAIVAGALSGYIGPYVYAAASNTATYFAMDTCIEALIGGIEMGARAWLDGEDGKKIIQSMGQGFAIAMALSAGFKVAGVVVEKIARKISPVIKEASIRINPTVKKKLSKLQKVIAKKIKNFEKWADGTKLHSEYISEKITDKQLEKLLEEGSKYLKDKSIKKLSLNDMFDMNDKPISKSELSELFDEAPDNTVLAYFKVDEDIIEVVKVNGIVSVRTDETKYLTVELDSWLNANKYSRDDNLKNAVEKIKKVCSKDSERIPEVLADAIEKSNVKLEDMSVSKLHEMIKKSGLTLHENGDMKTITLMPRKIHESIKHMGGFGLAKHLKFHQGHERLSSFISAASMGTITAVTE